MALLIPVKSHGSLRSLWFCVNLDASDSHGCTNSSRCVAGLGAELVLAALMGSAVSARFHPFAGSQHRFWQIVLVCSRLLNTARVEGGQVGCEDKVEQELLVAAPWIWAVGLLSFFFPPQTCGFVWEWEFKEAFYCSWSLSWKLIWEMFRASKMSISCVHRSVCWSALP